MSFLARRHVVQVDDHAVFAFGAHLARRAGNARRAHILHADYGVGLNDFKTSLQQFLFFKRIAHLNGRQTLRAVLINIR